MKMVKANTLQRAFDAQDNLNGILDEIRSYYLGHLLNIYELYQEGNHDEAKFWEKCLSENLKATKDIVINLG